MKVDFVPNRFFGVLERLALIGVVLTAVVPSARADFATCVFLGASGPNGGTQSAATYASYTGGAFCGFSGGLNYTPDGTSNLTRGPWLRDLPIHRSR